MQIEYFKEYSYSLNRDMEFKVYGHDGIPFLVFPSQDGRFYDFENNGMVNTVSNFIEEGKIQLFACDSIDKEGWSNCPFSYEERADKIEAYYHYIVDELVNRIHELRGSDERIMCTGCSMGATHSMNFFLRRPDLFKGTIAMSGIYHASYFLENYSQSIIYDNSPLDYLPNMPFDHEYLDLYRNSDIIFSCGQGPYEDDMYVDARRLKELFDDFDVDSWYDEWGLDSAHDWPWWQKQLPYFMAIYLDFTN